MTEAGWLVHELLVVRSIDVVREVDKELCEAALGCGIVAEDRRESSIAERFGKALTQGFASASVIAQALNISIIRGYDEEQKLTEENSERRA